MASLVRCNTSFATATVVYPAGAGVPADDPVVRKFPQFFDLPESAPVVEQATAAPGEVRNVPAKKAGARKAAAKPKD